jgi:deaminated glutathione amidase
MHLISFKTARAIENQCYVIAAAQYGQHNEKRVSYGHSLVVDGWGTVIADAGGMDSTIQPSSTQPTITTCEIDLTTIDAIRERMPIQQHRADAHLAGKPVYTVDEKK